MKRIYDFGPTLLEACTDLASTWSSGSVLLVRWLASSLGTVKESVGRFMMFFCRDVKVISLQMLV